jgi:hypothetical protein
MSTKRNCYTEIQNVGASNKYLIQPPYPSTVLPLLFKVYGQPEQKVTNDFINQIPNTNNCNVYKTWNNMSCLAENNTSMANNSQSFNQYYFAPGFNDVGGYKK